jgi:hypothetical protein
MYNHVDGWDWLWMTLMTGLWVVILGLVIYVAVKLAQGDRNAGRARRIASRDRAPQGENPWSR